MPPNVFAFFLPSVRKFESAVEAQRLLILLSYFSESSEFQGRSAREQDAKQEAPTRF